jgi:hypothetical protein
MRSGAVPAGVWMLLSAMLHGCGGSGTVDPRPPALATIEAVTPSAIAGDPPQTYLIRPGASWKPSQPSDRFVDSLATVDLSLVNAGQPVPAGRTLELRSVGSFYFDPLNNLRVEAVGLLVDAAGQRLAPGSGSTVAATSSAVDCGQVSGPDVVPEDFQIPTGSVATLVVPSGAVALRLSVEDCFYNDNRVYPPDPIRVTVTLRP